VGTRVNFGGSMVGWKVGGNLIPPQPPHESSSFPDLPAEGGFPDFPGRGGFVPFPDLLPGFLLPLPERPLPSPPHHPPFPPPTPLPWFLFSSPRFLP